MGLDFHMGIDARQGHRIADLVYSDPPTAFVARRAAPGDEPGPTLQAMRDATYATPLMDLDIVNTPRWRAAEFPSTNPQSNARSVATVFGAMANVLNGATQSNLPARTILEDAITARADGTDLILGRPTKFGLGLQLSQPDRPLGNSAHAFGHYGNGGHLGFGDPEHNLGFAYHMNHQGWAWRDPRNIALVDAVYASL